MIDVDIKLETTLIVKDDLLSKFKSFDISAIIGCISAAELDNCGNIIYRSSIIDDHYPNTFTIMGVNVNKTALQVIVNPSICEYTYTISLQAVNKILKTNYVLEDINKDVADSIIKFLYLG